MNVGNSVSTRETRAAGARKKRWTPPNTFETPEPPEGFKYRFVRYRNRNEDDAENVYKRMSEGYVPVKPEELGDYKTDTIKKEGDFQGTVRRGDTILMKIEQEIADDRNEHFKRLTALQQSQVDGELGEESDKSGIPVTREFTSDVQYRRKRKAS